MSPRYSRPGRGDYTLSVETNMVEITSDWPSPDPHWQATDSNGHTHSYVAEHIFIYPSLRLVVDASHWCNGDEGIAPHDPHTAVDESHWECRECGEVVEPGMFPPCWPRWMPGSKTATLDGLRSDGARVTVHLTGGDVEVIETEGDTAAQRILDDPGHRPFTTTWQG